MADTVGLALGFGFAVGLSLAAALLVGIKVGYDLAQGAAPNLRSLASALKPLRVLRATGAGEAVARAKRQPRPPDAKLTPAEEEVLAR